MPHFIQYDRRGMLHGPRATLPLRLALLALLLGASCGKQPAPPSQPPPSVATNKMKSPEASKAEPAPGPSASGKRNEGKTAEVRPPETQPAARFAVQVGAFQNRATAEALMWRLS